MTLLEICEYIEHTPENTNLTIVRQKLKEYKPYMDNEDLDTCIDYVRRNQYCFSRISFSQLVEQTKHPYLALRAISDNATVKLYVSKGTVTWSGSYSYDCETWIEYTLDTVIEVPKYHTIYWKGTRTDAGGQGNRLRFELIGQWEAHKNVLSLYYEDDFETRTTIDIEACCVALFNGCAGLVTPPYTLATTLAYGSFGMMYQNCTSLIKTMDMPTYTCTEDVVLYATYSGCTSLTQITFDINTTLVGYFALGQTFQNCSSLKKAPDTIIARTIDELGAYSMFLGTGLEYAPTLITTQIKIKGCYCMFESCASLRSMAPMPLLTSVGERGCSCMYYECTSLTEVAPLMATWTETLAFGWMFQGCTSLKKSTYSHISGDTQLKYREKAFYYMYKNCTSLEYPMPITFGINTTRGCLSGCYGMYENCTALKTINKLYCTHVPYMQYANMYKGCTNVKVNYSGKYPWRVYQNGTAVEGYEPCADMFLNTGGEFTGTPDVSVTYYLDIEPI